MQEQENHASNNNKLNSNSLNNNTINKTDDEDDDQINKLEKPVQNNWQEKWQYHFGDQQLYTQQIQDGLSTWLRMYDGDRACIPLRRALRGEVLPVLECHPAQLVGGRVAYD